MEMPEKSNAVNENAADLTLNEAQQQAEKSAKEETPTTDASDAADPGVAPADEKPAEAPSIPADDAASHADEAPERPRPQSCEEVVALLTVIAEKPADEIGREEVSGLKQIFYNFRKAIVGALRDKFVADGNAPEAFEEPVDPLEERLKAILAAIKEKKAGRQAEIEAEHKRNYDAKEVLIVEINTLAADTDNVNRTFPRFREIQQEFKAIGNVAPQLVNEQWKKFQDAVEHFYDQLKVNKDLRDYDFKKNLETKQQLCDEAEKLTAEGDIITAFKRLQDLHINWRETGPVAKEVRQEIWDRFKEASAAINKKYQAYFEERKQREQQNEEAKTALIERLEALNLDELKSYADWNAATDTILAAQAEWKQLGFASKKVNTQLYNRFRELCDNFFTRKADYFKKVKDEYADNLARKIAIIEEAEALKESTEWKKTAERLVALQKQWKTIGAVPRKHSDSIWERFMAACDHFFERKKTDFNSTRRTEQDNLKAKRELTASLRALPDDADRATVLEAINSARAKWQEIGHVPFREKDKAYEEFRTAINELYTKHDLRETRANMQRFENAIDELAGDENKLYRERERLARVLETKRSELATYNNNLGFFNFKSAGASSLQREIERKTRRLKDDIADLENKIKLIDEKSE